MFLKQLLLLCGFGLFFASRRLEAKPIPPPLRNPLQPYDAAASVEPSVRRSPPATDRRSADHVQFRPRRRPLHRHHIRRWTARDADSETARPPRGAQNQGHLFRRRPMRRGVSADRGAGSARRPRNRESLLVASESGQNVGRGRASANCRKPMTRSRARPASARPRCGLHMARSRRARNRGFTTRSVIESLSGTWIRSIGNARAFPWSPTGS